MRNINNVFFWENRIFKIFWKFSVTTKPWKSVFDSSAFRQNFKSRGQILWNIHSDIMKLFKIIFEMLSVSVVSTYTLYCRIVKGAFSKVNTLPFVSWIFAAWTWTASIFPIISVTIWYSIYITAFTRFLLWYLLLFPDGNNCPIFIISQNQIILNN